MTLFLFFAVYEDVLGPKSFIEDCFSDIKESKFAVKKIGLIMGDWEDRIQKEIKLSLAKIRYINNVFVRYW